MFRNIVLKKILKSIISNFFLPINKIIPKNEYKILIYSPTNNRISHNSRAIYEYLIENNYNSKYKIYCSVTNIKFHEHIYKNIKYISQLSGILHFFTSGHIIYSYGQIPIKPTKRQIAIQTGHGVGFKTYGKLSKLKNGNEFYFTYKLINSEIYFDICAKEWGCSINNLALCGEPVTDIFYKNTNTYNLGNYHKFILWTPTFRQSNHLNYNNSSNRKLLNIFNETDYEDLNNKLKEYNIKLIVKLHGAQDLDLYTYINYSHLEIYSEEDFVNEGYELYRMLKQVDALISDYSSIFLQYLLLDKPMAFVSSDFEEYEANRGFVFKNPKDYMQGMFIQTKKEFYEFIYQINMGIDEYKIERNKIKDIIHKYQDGENCKRVLEICNIINN